MGELPVDYYVTKKVDEATARRFMGKTPQMIRFFNEKTGLALTPIFDEYLRYAELPALDLAFLEGGQVAYRWKARWMKEAGSGSTTSVRVFLSLA